MLPTCCNLLEIHQHCLFHCYLTLELVVISMIWKGELVLFIYRAPIQAGSCSPSPHFSEFQGKAGYLYARL